MASAAVDVEHEDMPRVAVRAAQRYRPLLYIGQMARLARMPWGDAAVQLSRRGSPRPLHHVGNEHLVLLEEVDDMAFLTGEIPVLAHLPRLIGFLHHVAGGTELGVFFGVLVIPEAHDAAGQGDKQQQQYYRLVVLFDKGGAEFRKGFPRHPSAQIEDVIPQHQDARVSRTF